MGMLQKNHGKNMKLARLLALPALAALAVIGMSQNSRAALVASDNASNYTTSDWGTASKGTGFGSWAFKANANGGSAGTYLDTSSKGIATSGDSWGVYANNGNGTSNINITRAFLPGVGSLATVGTLRDGQSFNIALESDGISNANAAFGFNLQGTGGTATPFTLKYQAGGTDAMTLTDASGSYSISGVNFADLNAGINVSFTLAGPVAGGNQDYSLSIDKTSGTSLATHSGMVSGALNQFEIFDTNTSGNGYFNSVAVTGTPVSAAPIPASFGLVLAGGLGLAGMALSRRRSRAQA